jgi:hypothetical protein
MTLNIRTVLTFTNNYDTLYQQIDEKIMHYGKVVRAINANNKEKFDVKYNFGGYRQRL